MDTVMDERTQLAHETPREGGLHGGLESQVWQVLPASVTATQATRDDGVSNRAVAAPQRPPFANVEIDRRLAVLPKTPKTSPVPVPSPSGRVRTLGGRAKTHLPLAPLDLIVRRRRGTRPATSHMDHASTGFCRRPPQTPHGHEPFCGGQTHGADGIGSVSPRVVFDPAQTAQPPYRRRRIRHAATCARFARPTRDAVPHNPRGDHSS